MKKIIIITATVLSLLTFAQKSSRKVFVYDEQQNAYIEARAPGDPGDPVPIDGYVPFLLIAGFGLIIWFSKRKYTAA